MAHPPDFSLSADTHSGSLHVPATKLMLKECLTCALLDGFLWGMHLQWDPWVSVTWFDATLPGSSQGQLLHLPSHQQDRDVPVYCSPYQHWAVASFLMTASPIGLKESHVIVLACLSD